MDLEGSWSRNPWHTSCRMLSTHMKILRESMKKDGAASYAFDSDNRVRINIFEVKDV